MRAESIEDTKKLSVKLIHHLSYLLDAFNKIKQFSQYDPELKSDVTLFAIAMLYVIAGTCARECLDKLPEGELKESL